MINNFDFKKIIDEENKLWSNIFKKELENSKEKYKKFSSYWWEYYYNELINFINPLILKHKVFSILEAGSGSGKASLLLNKNIKKVFLDISLNALDYARYLADKFQSKNIEYVLGNIFSMPFKSETFDFVWNIGVIEHYNIENIELIFKEMFRVVRYGGLVACGVPNLYSGPIIKAKLLKYDFLKFIPGYRLKTEKFYGESIMKKIMFIAAKKEGKQIEWVKVQYVGSPLPVEFPRFVIKTVGRLIEFILPRNKFLTVVICKIK